MNLTRPSEVRALLAQLDFHPSKVLGQNFLIDANVRQIIIQAARLAPADTVLEVGPGLGVLTEGLAQEANRIVAVEKDTRLFQWLEKNWADTSRIELIRADILALNEADLAGRGVNKLVANLPYSIASRLLVELMLWERPLEKIVVTVQKEVAQRLNAAPGGKDYGLLGILCQVRYSVARLKDISPTCFLPPPEVTSAIVTLDRHAGALPTAAEMRALCDLLKHSFAQRRKQMRAAVRRAPGALGQAGAAVERLLEPVGIRPADRPENIKPEQWLALSRLAVPA